MNPIFTDLNLVKFKEGADSFVAKIVAITLLIFITCFCSNSSTKYEASSSLGKFSRPADVNPIIEDDREVDSDGQSLALQKGAYKIRFEL